MYLHRDARGFTLVEVVVVIAIIMLLAAILFPALWQARPKGSAASCLNNLRQIAVAFAMYVQDNEETFPPDTGTRAWSTVLTAYNEPSIYDCSTKTGKGSNNKPEYGFNSYLFGVTLGDIPQATNALLLADLVMDNPAPNYTLRTFSSDIDPRHNAGTNVACVDGHVAYVPLKNKTDRIAVALVEQEYDLLPAPGTALLDSAEEHMTGRTSNVPDRNCWNQPVNWVRIRQLNPFDTKFLPMPVGSFRDGTHAPAAVRISFVMRCDNSGSAAAVRHDYFSLFERGNGLCHSVNWQAPNIPSSKAIIVGEDYGQWGDGFKLWALGTTSPGQPPWNGNPAIAAQKPQAGTDLWQRYVVAILGTSDVLCTVSSSSGSRITGMGLHADLTDILTKGAGETLCMTAYSGSDTYNVGARVRDIRIDMW